MKLCVFCIPQKYAAFFVQFKLLGLLSIESLSIGFLIIASHVGQKKSKEAVYGKSIEMILITDLKSVNGKKW